MGMGKGMMEMEMEMEMMDVMGHSRELRDEREEREDRMVREKTKMEAGGKLMRQIGRGLVCGLWY
jgi:hypothetical protein